MIVNGPLPVSVRLALLAVTLSLLPLSVAWNAEPLSVSVTLESFGMVTTSLLPFTLPPRPVSVSDAPSVSRLTCSSLPFSVNGPVPPRFSTIGLMVSAMVWLLDAGIPSALVAVTVSVAVVSSPAVSVSPLS